jgi:signal transduction histidine kinase/CheY-like chemotaxis protein
MNAAPVEADDGGLDERRLQVLIDQGARLRLQIVFTASVVAGIALGATPAAWVIAWWLAAVGLREVRNVALQRMQAGRRLPVGLRMRRVVAWNGLLGAVNGSAALFMLHLDVTGDALLTMILVSWGAGGVATNATLPPAYLSIASFMFIPTAAMWLFSGGWLGVGTAVLVLMFLQVQLRYAGRNCDTFEESYRMRQENAELARRLAQESREVALARDAAESANTAKSHFLAAASHDLRQPLQALALNSSELVRANADPGLAALASEIKHSVGDLRTMLDRLLDLSSLDAGAVQVQPRQVSLTTLLEGVGASFRAAAAERALELRVACAPSLTLQTDPDLLRRLLSNLIDNAIKFTPSGRIDITATPGTAGIELAIADTGIGIPLDQQEHVFEEMVQLHNAQRDGTQGYGLGLTIVRRLARLLGIGLELRSAPGLGTTFLLHLTAAPSSAVAAPPAQSSSADDVRAVLVLDDDPRVRSAYARALTGRGMRTAVAGDTSQALALLAQAQPQVAVVDYRLAAGEDGLAAIAALRRASPGLPALLCSADASPELAAAAGAAGVSLLRKPIDDEALAQAIADTWAASR